jgi:hypothetical protein
LVAHGAFVFPSAFVRIRVDPFPLSSAIKVTVAFAYLCEVRPNLGTRGPTPSIDIQIVVAIKVWRISEITDVPVSGNKPGD